MLDQRHQEVTQSTRVSPLQSDTPSQLHVNFRTFSPLDLQNRTLSAGCFRMCITICVDMDP